jgi:predicted porin
VENRGNGQYIATTTTNPNGVVTGSTTGHKARGAWSYQPGAVLGLIWTRSEVKNGGAAQTTGYIAASSGLGVNAGSGTVLTQSAWTLNWEHLIGNTRLLAQYSKAGNIKNCETQAAITLNGTTTSACDSTGSKAYMLGVQYLLSKRTSVHVAYNQISNSSNYFADYGSGNNSSYTSSGITVANMAGADPKMFGVGLQHNF